MGARDRPTFLPPEEPPPGPPYGPPGEPPEEHTADPPANPPAEIHTAPTGQVRPVAAARRARVLALVTGGILVLGGALVWANRLPGGAGPAEPPGFTRLTDICSMVPAASVQPLVPRSAGRPYAPPGGGTLRAEAYAACSWTTGRSIWTGSAPHRQRRLHVNVRVLLTRDKMTGQAATRLQYAAALAGAQDMAAKRIRLDSGTTEYWPVVPLRGIGDTAYGQYEINRSGVSNVGLGRTIVRLRNAFITVEYSGSDYPSTRSGFADRSRATPVAGADAQQGAARVAAELTRALAACFTCMN